MVDTKKALEKKYLDAEYVKGLVDKGAIITGEGDYVPTDYGDRLTIPLGINGTPKLYQPNRDSVKNIVDAYGTDTKSWISKRILLSTVNIKGKYNIVAYVNPVEYVKVK
jgi:hypothetical protein